MIALSTASFVSFGVFSLPAGWLADRWSRRNMMALFFGGCGVSLVGCAFAPNLPMLAAALFGLGMFAAIYHPVGMAMLIEASQARGRTLAFNGVCGNLGVSLAAGVSAALATWLGWRAAFLLPAVVVARRRGLVCLGTPDDGHHAKNRVSKPAVPLTPRLAGRDVRLVHRDRAVLGHHLQPADHRPAEDRRRTACRQRAAAARRQRGDAGADLRRAGAALRRPAGRALHRAQDVRGHYGVGLSRQSVGGSTPTASC